MYNIIYTKMNAFNDFEKYGLDFVLKSYFKYKDFVEFIERNDLLQIPIIEKLIKKRLIKKIRYTYIDYIHYVFNYNESVEREIEEADNLNRLYEYFNKLTYYDGTTIIDELMVYYNGFKNWKNKNKKIHEELIITIFNKERGIKSKKNNNSYKKTELYKELYNRKKNGIEKRKYYIIDYCMGDYLFTKYKLLEHVKKCINCRETTRINDNILSIMNNKAERHLKQINMTADEYYYKNV